MKKLLLGSLVLLFGLFALRAVLATEFAGTINYQEWLSIGAIALLSRMLLARHFE